MVARLPTGEELREICRAEYKRPYISLSERAGALQEKSEKKKDEKNPFLLDQATSAAKGIQELINTVDIETLRNSVDRLAQARRIVVIGAMMLVPEV